MQKWRSSRDVEVSVEEEEALVHGPSWCCRTVVDGDIDVVYFALLEGSAVELGED
jgi:hypothetical protein